MGIPYYSMGMQTSFITREQQIDRIIEEPSFILRVERPILLSYRLLS